MPGPDEPGRIHDPAAFSGNTPGLDPHAEESAGGIPDQKLNAEKAELLNLRLREEGKSKFEPKDAAGEPEPADVLESAASATTRRLPGDAPKVPIRFYGVMREASEKVINPNGDSVFTLAAAEGNTEVVKRLLREGSIDLFHRNRAGNTALSIAISKGFLDIATLIYGAMEHLPSEQLLSACLERDDEGNTLLHQALLLGHTESFERLTSIMAPENLHRILSVQNNLGETILHSAVQLDNLALLQSLMEKLAPEQRSSLCWLQNSNGENPLSLAASQENYEAIRALLHALPSKEIASLCLASKIGEASFLDGIARTAPHEMHVLRRKCFEFYTRAYKSSMFERNRLPTPDDDLLRRALEFILSFHEMDASIRTSEDQSKYSLARTMLSVVEGETLATYMLKLNSEQYDHFIKFVKMPGHPDDPGSREAFILNAVGEHSPLRVEIKKQFALRGISTSSFDSLSIHRYASLVDYSDPQKVDR